MIAKLQIDPLLEDVKQGTKDARNRLFQKHRSTVEKIVESRLDAKLRQRMDTSDVVQDVLMEANRRLMDYLIDPKLPFDNWLKQIAKDKIIDAYRRHRGSMKRSMDNEVRLNISKDRDDNTELDICSRGNSPCEEAIKKELIGLINQRISNLEDHHRQIIQLRFFEQKSNQEVAQEMGISEPAASMRLLRALKIFRKEFAC